MESKNQESNIDELYKKNLSTNISGVNELINVMSKTYEKNSEFRNQIANVIRNEMSSEAKIEEISNILI